ncbi:YpjP family protein [Bacillus sp. Marseille-P3661]|uniref:YpjP family protein n=1 Tax=Bacillus sp. Marseille-P3661 TaxID=1936234 RepID=UPI000C81F610|nr:YpjP family protein [Bacillus sp. Marseille-P3661]
MKIWMRKIFVVFVTILTFGMVVPHMPTNVDRNVKENSDVSDKQDSLLLTEEVEEQQETNQELSWDSISTYIDNREELISTFTAYSTNQAEQLSMMKFGRTIAPVIGDEFKQVILPKIEEAISTLAQELDEDVIRELVISENPAKGLGEKIFHVYNRSTGEDLIRFHVRRDHPPMDGYWFNFHYHKYTDRFQTHHTMGSIYWDKNTPPHWMSA